MKLFGSSGIRGLANKEISGDLAISLGEVLGTLHQNIVIGHDPRTSNRLLLSAVTSGLLSTGCAVSHAGLVTTPTLAYAARNFDCGIMITASHNPPEDNGLKFFNPDGSGFNTEQMLEMEDILAKKQVKKAKWDSIKITVSYQNAVEDHIQGILDQIPNLNLTVVVDCGCGSASTITPYLFRRLGCQVITLNCQPDGFFPGRRSEPTSENLGSLIDAVISNKADIGIAHDGDADRMVAVDEKGNFADGDALLSLFAQHEVKQSVVVPVDASMAVDRVVGDASVIRTKVGDVFVSEMIKKHDADFGGEPSGTWIFPRMNLCPDGIFAAARLGELVAKQPLSSQLSALPRFPRKKGTIKCPNDMKYEILGQIETRFADLSPQSITTDDGVRAQFESSWALVRASGTEPKIRISTEAEDVKGAQVLYDKVYEMVKGCVV